MEQHLRAALGPAHMLFLLHPPVHQVGPRSIPERSMNTPGANCRATGEPATGAGKPSGKELAAKADLDPTLQDSKRRRLT